MPAGMPHRGKHDFLCLSIPAQKERDRLDTHSGFVQKYDPSLFGGKTVELAPKLMAAGGQSPVIEGIIEGKECERGDLNPGDG